MDAQKIQDEIFKKMTFGQKIKLTSELLQFAKKLSGSNNLKIDGNRRPLGKNSKGAGRT